jgi:hypothetical protein
MSSKPREALDERHLPYLFGRLKGDVSREEHAGVLREIHDASDYLTSSLFDGGSRPRPCTTSRCASGAASTTSLPS